MPASPQETAGIIPGTQDTEMDQHDRDDDTFDVDDGLDEDEDDALMVQLLEIVEAETNVEENSKRLKDALAEMKRAQEQAARLRKQATKPKLDASLTRALDKLSSSQPEGIREKLDRMRLDYGKTANGDREAQEAADDARQRAKQALLDLVEAKAAKARAERELAMMQQPQAGDDEGSQREATPDSDEEGWRAAANQMASMLDRTFLKTGPYDASKPPALKSAGAWYCGELKLWYVAPGKEKEVKNGCLAKWPEHVLSFEQFRTLLEKKFGWSEK